MGNGDVNPKSFIPSFFFPLIAMIVGGVVAYYASEVTTASSLALIEGRSEALISRVSVIERWLERTEGNRFTSFDGDRLDRVFSSKLETHEKIPAHSDVLPRLARIETQLDRLRQEVDEMHRLTKSLVESP